MSDTGTKEVTLEGFHVCKHAIRFNADIIELVTANKHALAEITKKYAPDIASSTNIQVQEISTHDFENYSDIEIRTPLAGKAYIPKHSFDDIPENTAIVLLDNPRDLENIGAVVRVSAGLGAGAVCTTGEHDPWHKNALRAGQGTHFALPIFHMKSTLPSDFLNNRLVYVFDESGEDMQSMDVSGNAILVFGSERAGVSKEWLEQADKIVRIPQRSGISSYNLATAVAMGLYHYRCRK